MKKYLIIAAALMMAGCQKDSKKTEKAPAPDGRTDQVVAEMHVLGADADSLSDPDTGWIANDCDGFAWEGERRAALLPESDALLKAELEPGKFDRRPQHGCDFTWSRDMAIIGLFPWAWLHQRRDVLEAHQAYGRAHPTVFQGFPSWTMGEPFGDGRTVYPPDMIGLLAKLVHGLGGSERVEESIWPSVYPSGLTDFEAHLQVMGIWIRGEVSNGVKKWEDCPNAKAPDGTISKTMYDRLVEHAKREPQNPLYQAVLGKYTGDMAPAIDAFLAGTVGTYVRCGDDVRRCTIPERMFAGRVILRQFGKDQAGAYELSASND